ncbi:ribonuclease Z [Hydrogenoanaerobacterium sp.]|uniref:ribonuclease Z n=1 Tax=Hydrogenoanaerobacterium sp. TaxID=2953763 RepID=UPI00289E1307|nr:ribonuclease Z [Hydrogenoanaerobacterium sp.]
MLDVCLPGTGGVLPLENRWLTCCWVEYQGKAILIDCGEGTQIALKKAGCKLSRLDVLLITHFHADHIAGLPGLLLTLGNTGKTTPLIIAGPVGLERVVSALTAIVPVQPYPIDLVELKGDRAEKLKKSEMEISCLPLRHGMPCLGYRIAIKRKPIFNPFKAQQLEIPKPLYETLHAGQAIQLEDGRVIEPNMVLDGVRDPIQVCYCTDTQPIDEISDFARGADLLICEGMYGDDTLHNKMKEKGHMVFSDSAQIAKKAGVKQLWLTHYSPAMANPEQYLDEARKIFPQTVAAHDGICTTLGNSKD